MSIIVAIVAAIMVFIGGVGVTLVTGYGDQREAITKLRHEATLSDHRVASYKRMIDRRDAAIEASACKARIQYWLKNPSDIPQPFKPFGSTTVN